MAGTLPSLLQDSRIARSMTPLSSPAWPEVSDCIDAALRSLSRTATEQIQDEEAAEEAALCELLGRGLGLDDALGTGLEDKPALRFVAEAKRAGQTNTEASQTAQAVAVVAVAASAAPVETTASTSSGCQVVDQDFRAQHDQNDAAEELEFFANAFFADG